MSISKYDVNTALQQAKADLNERVRRLSPQAKSEVATSALVVNVEGYIHEFAALAEAMRVELEKLTAANKELTFANKELVALNLNLGLQAERADQRVRDTQEGWEKTKHELDRCEKRVKAITSEYDAVRDHVNTLVKDMTAASVRYQALEVEQRRKDATIEELKRKVRILEAQAAVSRAKAALAKANDNLRMALL